MSFLTQPGDHCYIDVLYFRKGIRHSTPCGQQIFSIMAVVDNLEKFYNFFFTVAEYFLGFQQTIARLIFKKVLGGFIQIWLLSLFYNETQGTIALLLFIFAILTSVCTLGLGGLVHFSNGEDFIRTPINSKTIVDRICNSDFMNEEITICRALYPIQVGLTSFEYYYFNMLFYESLYVMTVITQIGFQASSFTTYTIFIAVLLIAPVALTLIQIYKERKIYLSDHSRMPKYDDLPPGCDLIAGLLFITSYFIGIFLRSIFFFILSCTVGPVYLVVTFMPCAIIFPIATVWLCLSKLLSILRGDGKSSGFNFSTGISIWDTILTDTAGDQ